LILFIEKPFILSDIQSLFGYMNTILLAKIE